jgi:hypothetical protein
MNDIISLIGVSNEFEIYLGYFSALEARKKEMGRNRIFGYILTLRSLYFNRFFTNLSADKIRYKKLHSNKANF